MRAKAITLTQPWASLVDFRHKRLETRGWHPKPEVLKAGDLLVIHAAKGFPKEARAYCDHPAFIAGLNGLRADALPLAAGLCVVTLRHLVRTTEIYKLDALGFPIGKLETTYGNYESGRWAWAFDYVGRFPVPVPAAGALSVWNWPYEINLLELLPVEDPLVKTVSS